jgi:hypothetical protein
MSSVIDLGNLRYSFIDSFLASMVGHIHTILAFQSPISDNIIYTKGIKEKVTFYHLLSYIFLIIIHDYF